MSVWRNFTEVSQLETKNIFHVFRWFLCRSESPHIFLFFSSGCLHYIFFLLFCTTAVKKRQKGDTDKWTYFVLALLCPGSRWLDPQFGHLNKRQPEAAIISLWRTAEFLSSYCPCGCGSDSLNRHLCNKPFCPHLHSLHLPKVLPMSCSATFDSLSFGFKVSSWRPPYHV